jgi:hypothetical protein
MVETRGSEMAYARTRSANAELNQGMIDGSYKQIIKDRGGDVELATWYARDELAHNILFNICEPDMYDLPDVQKFVSPYRVKNAGAGHDNPSMAGVDMYTEK